MADGLGQDIFKQLPVPVLQNASGRVDVGLEGLDEVVEGELLSTLFQQDAQALPKVNGVVGSLKTSLISG